MSNYNVLYIGNYMLEDVIDKRKNKKVFSQAGNNKMSAMKEALKYNGCNVCILSNGWMNSFTCLNYKGFRSHIDSDVIYLDIIDIPIINLVSVLWSGIQKIKEIICRNSIDCIIFYNFRPENSLIAYWAKKKYSIPIIVEYEDGYGEIYKKGIKHWFFANLERWMKKYINAAILVNSKMENEFHCPTLVVRGIIDRANNFGQKTKKPVKISPVLFYGGTLDEERGIDILLAAMDKCKEVCRLQISGKGPLEPLVHSYAGDHIEYLGFLSHKEMLDKMYQADILINPQRQTNGFGDVSFPSKLFEYIKTQNMIVSSSVSDVKTALKDLVILYFHDNANDLAMAIDIAVKKLDDAEYMENRKMQVNHFIKENSVSEIGRKLVNQIIEPICFQEVPHGL